ncbi:hypothetical protein [Psychromonas aquatilis]|uniref:Uncharacterized protein n=1 Tax=Psychromonas aquatilis TaxID=2005072 RepID=A0ABU9GRP7_9GAMM
MNMMNKINEIKTEKINKELTKKAVRNDTSKSISKPLPKSVEMFQKLTTGVPLMGKEIKQKKAVVKDYKAKHINRYPLENVELYKEVKELFRELNIKASNEEQMIIQGAKIFLLEQKKEAEKKLNKQKRNGEMK